MSESSFYFASTPLHILLFTSLAAQEPSNKHILLLIDQTETANNLYVECLKQWPECPFTEVAIFGGQNAKGKKKVEQRKAIFQSILSLVKAYQPNKLYTGSDKRLEFQYCAAQLTSAKKIYVDEGMYSYIAPSLLKQFGHTLFDTPAKKLTYGSWYSSTPYTGGSKWIDEVLAIFPEQLHAQLQKKATMPFPISLLNQPSVKDFSNQLFKKLNYDPAGLNECKAIFSLPHESLLPEPKAWIDLFGELDHAQIPFAVKYHPRDKQADKLQVGGFGIASIIPNKLFFEAILPYLNETTLIAGDVSSALLFAKKLQPAAPIVALEQAEKKLPGAITTLYKQINIPIIPQKALSNYF